jgi:hypothetical protein
LIEEGICQEKISLVNLGHGDVFWFFPSKLIIFFGKGLEKKI